MHHSQPNNCIGFADIATKLPKFISKVPHILSGLKQAYLRTPHTPTGLGIAFEKAVRRNPTGYALKFEQQQFTYAELNQWANQIAHFYLSLGLQKGDVIAIMMQNRPELIATVIALAKIGVISALVNTSQAGQVLSQSINLVQPTAIIVGEECQDVLIDIQSQLNLAAEHYYWWANQALSIDSGIAPQGFNNLHQLSQSFATFNPATTHQVQGQDGLFYIYTSGTTGLPKAVIFTHSRWMLAYGTYGHILNLNQDDVMYCTLPLYHATGIVVCWCGVIAASATFVIRRKYSTSAFWSDIQKYNVSAFGYVGELCRYLLDAPVHELEQGHRVHTMIGNGMRAQVWDKFKTRFAINEVLELYASSEGNVGFSNIFNFDHTMGFSPTPYAIIKFDQTTQQAIRDSKGWYQKVKKGDVGLLIGKITSRSPFDGYSDPQKNQSVIMKNVFKNGDAYFNTGDLVRDIGFRHAQFIDRVGDSFRWKGENVSTLQVENILSEHPKIAEAVVYGVEIPNTEGRAGMAAITLIADTQLTTDDFKEMYQQFKTVLPAYAIPIFLRIQHHLETTATFKYQKNTLKQQAFDLNQVNDQVLILLPGQNSYCLLNDEIFHNIQQHQYRF
ncbi:MULTISPECIES: long-chain-acyl-CoA synthetase [unclassified Acinetobacter]|uniref:long-chain-acyl-CoA synthetase n=1 Tax=unclassified Acinetobacter TaxID=196816 RepID=UPI002934FD9A|nr:MULTISPECIES: long-chain-acyl-CoA synthetase [unclassified Acinetobacter]WOE30557.1 long-chain-acyl-CoA synthetase [Acinetobacter sp. SAAs470]WOE38749.1 long-chain-acyl-CoA synthetase [Acinetobacter sp. SAAs474]